MKSSANAPHILFEDQHLLLVSKPQGWLSQRDSSSSLPDLETWAEEYRRVHEGKPGRAYVRACHRLDTPVSAIVCLAKTSKAHQRLQQAQMQGHWRKRYLALVRPGPTQTAGLLTHWLIQREGRARVVKESSPKAKQAQLRYQRLATQRGVAALGVELYTGRYHQIRAQLAAMGWPILGDLKYGSPEPLWQEGIALHAVGLSLPHPTRGDWVRCQDLPDWAPKQIQVWLRHLDEKSGPIEASPPTPGPIPN
jgi:23S rRNA pseudouridine1911/1915/1917 synthase